MTAGYLVASCYGDGRVVRVDLAGDGRLGTASVADTADDPYAASAVPGSSVPDFSAPEFSGPEFSGPELSGPIDSSETESPRASHAHAAAFLPDGRIATTDLGFDLVRILRHGRSGLIADHQIALPRGTGPRHMVVHPSGHLHVVTEYSCEVFTLAAGADGRWTLVSGTAVSPAVQVGVDYASELSRSRDGETLYAGVRGSNTIAALRVRGDGGIALPLALADERTGAPRSLRHRTQSPTPTSILLAR